MLPQHMFMMGDPHVVGGEDQNEDVRSVQLPDGTKVMRTGEVMNILGETYLN